MRVRVPLSVNFEYTKTTMYIIEWSETFYVLPKRHIVCTRGFISCSAPKGKELVDRVT